MKQTKDSGIEWIGEIPEDWTTTNLKNLFDLYLGSTPKSDDSDNWDGDITWICPSDFKTEDKYVYSGRRNLSQKGYDSCSTTLVEKGSLIFTKRAPVGTIGIAETSLCPGTGCIACTPKQGVNSPFYYYVLSICTDEFNSYSAGTTFMEISLTKFSEFKVMVPPTADQNKIAGCLDRITSRFASLITNLNNQIDKLKDYKKALITKCVTKGLDPNVPLKDSGIDWLGPIPKNWKILKGKFALTLLNRPVLETDGVITCFRDGEVTLRSNRREEGFTFSTKEIGYQGIEKGDLVVHGMDGFAGAIGISDSRGKGSPILNVLDTPYNKRFIMYYLRGIAYRDVFVGLSTGIRVRSCDLRWNKLADLFFVIPPLSEQNKIASYLDKKCADIDNIISSKQQQIDKLNEYQKSLIYEYVTGKKEVV